MMPRSRLSETIRSSILFVPSGSRPSVGLVQDEQPGLLDEQLGDAQPLPHAARVGAHQLVAFAIEAHRGSGRVSICAPALASGKRFSRAM